MADRALVVGAGIMGLSAAWALRRDGWQVEIVEQGPVPNPVGSSVDRHRLIRHAYGAERGYMRMVDAAYAAWAEVWADIGETLHVPTGVLALADPADTPWMGDTRRALAEDGRGFEDIPAAAVASRFPFLAPSAHDALFVPAGSVLLADRIVAALAARSTILRARVAGLDPERAAVTLDDGSVRSADLLVVTSGPWTPRLLPGLKPCVTPSRQVVVYVEPPAALASAWAQAPMLLDLGGGFYAVPPVAGTGLKVGDHTFSLQGDPEDDDRTTGPQEVQAILDRCAGRLADFGRYRVVETRVCFYDVTPEERFVVAPIGARAWVMAGFSGHGFKFGPCLGRALARAARDAAAARTLPAWASGL
jgi:sarcosine oxidase subunit beta